MFLTNSIYLKVFRKVYCGKENTLDLGGGFVVSFSTTCCVRDGKVPGFEMKL